MVESLATETPEAMLLRSLDLVVVGAGKGTGPAAKPAFGIEAIHRVQVYRAVMLLVLPSSL